MAANENIKNTNSWSNLIHTQADAKKKSPPPLAGGSVLVNEPARSVKKRKGAVGHLYSVLQIPVLLKILGGILLLPAGRATSSSSCPPAAALALVASPWAFWIGTCVTVLACCCSGPDAAAYQCCCSGPDAAEVATNKAVSVDLTPAVAA